ncbi:MAG: hypothetical protein IJW64_02975 [Clostridia bacterium]|nr:hypothetical protein [Clostridia bacterium]
MEKKKIQKCWNCGSYRAYYTRRICSYDKTGVGFCNKKDEIVKNCDCCKEWSKNYKMKGIRNGLRKKVLERISEDISMIKQILTEEESEKYE